MTERSRPAYYDKGGEPLELMQWAKLFEDPDYRIVKKTELPNGKLVSTIWLGLDHGFFMNERPVIFETMVFGEDEEDMERYATIEEAEAGHEKMVKKHL